MNSHCFDASGETDRKALDDFFSGVQCAARESAAAAVVAKPALARIVADVAGRDHAQALRVRTLLLSLYTGGSVLADLSELLALDWNLRRDLCAVFLAFNLGDFSYEYMRGAFARPDDPGARWFLGEDFSPFANAE